MIAGLRVNGPILWKKLEQQRVGSYLRTQLNSRYCSGPTILEYIGHAVALLVIFMYIYLFCGDFVSTL